MLKFLLVLLVVGIGLWALTSRSRARGPQRDRDADAAAGRPAGAPPTQMVECAHCGVHLPAADALAEGSRLYCSDAHRRLGPAQPPAP